MIRVRPVYLVIMEVPVTVSVLKSVPQHTSDTFQTRVPGYYGSACNSKCFSLYLSIQVICVRPVYLVIMEVPVTLSVL